MGCDTCCPEPPCPAPSLECVSFSQSKSKVTPCGFFNDGKYWLIKTTTLAHAEYWTSICGDDCSYVCSASDVATYSASDPCSVSYVYSGSATYDYWCGPTHHYGTWTRRTDGGWDESGYQYPAYGPACESVSVVYSSENAAESTAALISRTVAALPVSPNGTDCSALRNLSPDESSYSIRRTKWRVAHSPTGTCYLKVWLRTRFVPEGGGTEIITPLTAYEWTATGNPCLPDLTKGPDHADNIIRSDETEEQEPAEDGTTYVEIVKWSCQPGYTPPDDGSANGLPPFAP